MLNDKDVVGIMAAILYASAKVDVPGGVDGVVDLAYRMHTAAAARVVRGDQPLDDVTSTR